MNWYLQSGKDSDVVTSTRIRFARNLQGFKFNLKTKTDIDKLKNKIKENVFAIGYDMEYFELKDIDDITKMSLVEKNLISAEYALNKNDEGAILINKEENICIMINDDDHLKIQVFSSGFELENTLNFAIELDKKIEDVLGYINNLVEHKNVKSIIVTNEKEINNNQTTADKFYFTVDIFYFLCIFIK